MDFFSQCNNIFSHFNFRSNFRIYTVGAASSRSHIEWGWKKDHALHINDADFIHTWTNQHILKSITHTNPSTFIRFLYLSTPDTALHYSWGKWFIVACHIRHILLPLCSTAIGHAMGEKEKKLKYEQNSIFTFIETKMNRDGNEHRHLIVIQYVHSMAGPNEKEKRITKEPRWPKRKHCSRRRLPDCRQEKEKKNNINRRQNQVI